MNKEKFVSYNKRDLEPLKMNYEENKDMQLRKVVTLIDRYKSFTKMDGESLGRI